MPDDFDQFNERTAAGNAGRRGVALAGTERGHVRNEGDRHGDKAEDAVVYGGNLQSESNQIKPDQTKSK